MNCQFDLLGRDFEGRVTLIRSTFDLQKNAAGSQLSVNTKAPSTVKSLLILPKFIYNNRAR